MGFCLHIAGDSALFARPEFRDDQVTYDLITPHAARGTLNAIYRRPGMSWVIDGIRILRPIRHEIQAHAGRRTVILRDVAYEIEAHFELSSGESTAESGRHAEMFKRALRHGVATHLGSSRFAGTARLAHRSESDISSAEDQDYGWLLHGPDLDGDRRVRYFRAIAVDGRIAVPPPGSPLLFV